MVSGMVEETEQGGERITGLGLSGAACPEN